MHVSAADLRRAMRVCSKLETSQPLVKTLEELGMVDRATILATVRANPSALRLGDLLVELSYIRESDLKKALAVQAQDKERRKLGEILIETHLISERQLTEVLGDLLGLSYVEPRIADIEAPLLRKIAPAWCRQYSFIPLSVLDGKVLVAFGDPLDMTHRAAAQQMLACEIEPAITCKSLIRTTLEAIERGGRQNTGVVDDNAAVALVDTIIRNAAQLGASDIHIEPMRTHTRVRYRVDGVMMQHLEISSELTPSVTSRIKILAKADIAEKRRHQDGRIQFEDPDVIVLGEVRLKFSADVAIQAALTGHKVLTTFHTEDSIGCLLRLLNMDIEAFLISSTLVSVVAQRLVRKLCVHCVEPYVPTASELRRLGYTPADVASARFAAGKGCDQCRYTGYRGRICVFELLVLNEFIKDAIVARKTSHEIRRLGIETAGLVTLTEDGVHKAANGLTSLNEVIRALPRVTKVRPLREIRRILGD